jgi:hypothetical protein
MILSLLLQKKESHLRISAPQQLRGGALRAAPHRGDGGSSIQDSYIRSMRVIDNAMRAYDEGDNQSLPIMPEISCSHHRLPG